MSPRPTPPTQAVKVPFFLCDFSSSGNANPTVGFGIQHDWTLSLAEAINTKFASDSSYLWELSSDNTAWVRKRPMSSADFLRIVLDTHREWRWAKADPVGGWAPFVIDEAETAVVTGKEQMDESLTRLGSGGGFEEGYIWTPPDQDENLNSAAPSQPEPYNEQGMAVDSAHHVSKSSRSHKPKRRRRSE